MHGADRVGRGQAQSLTVPVEASPPRLSWVDALKVALTCGVIVAHAAITYGADGSWFYREPTGSSVLRLVLDIPLALGSLFGMGLFFFLAGCFVPTSIGRKGPRQFLADRWLRLGLPLAVFVLVVVPLVQWAVAVATDPAPFDAIWRVQLRELDAGPLWFVGILLLFSTVYVAWWVVRRPPPRPADLRVRTLVLCGAFVATVSFVIRLHFPVDSFQILAAHVWQWGQCAGLFGLGIAAGRQGWLTRIPDRIRRGSGLALAAGAAGVMGILVASSNDLDPLGGGWHWQAAVVAVLEGVISVSATVTLVTAFQRSHARGARLGRRAYAAYLLQTPVLVGLALLLRPIPVAGAVRLLVLAPAAVVACFALAAALLRIGPVRRIL